jgi:hypothetical protein
MRQQVRMIRLAETEESRVCSEMTPAVSVRNSKEADTTPFTIGQSGCRPRPGTFSTFGT